jgi:hypothetical protein
LEGEWRVIRLSLLEDHDLAVTKLKSFRTQDRDDLQFLADHGSLDPEVLRARLESAFMWSHPKEGDPVRERAFANLKKLIQYLEGRTRTLLFDSPRADDPPGK